MAFQTPDNFFKQLAKKYDIKNFNLGNRFLLLELQSWLPCQRRGNEKHFRGIAFNVVIFFKIKIKKKYFSKQKYPVAILYF